MNASSPSATVITPAFDQDQIAVLVATIFPLFVIGIVGNIVTLATIIVSPKLKSMWYDLILSLCVSDLIAAIISPLYIYKRIWGFDEWKLPAFVCSLHWGFESWTTYLTSLHILWFAILRFISIKWPHSFNNVLARYKKVSIFFIWFLTCATGFFPFLWIRPEIRNRSDPSPSSKWPACSPTKDLFRFFLIISQSTFVVYVFIPCILVIVFSIAIGFQISAMRKERMKQGARRNQAAEKKRTSKENQLLLQLGLIVGSFIFGYFPLIAFLLYTYNSTNSGPDATKFNWWFGAMQFISLRISECLNPCFYNLASSKMRKETMILLRRIWLKINCKMNAPTNGEIEQTTASNAVTNRKNNACFNV